MGQWSRFLCLFGLLGPFGLFASPVVAQGPSAGVPGAFGRPMAGPGVVPNAGQLPSAHVAQGRPMPPHHHGGGFGGPIVGSNLGFTTYGGDVSPDEASLPDEGALESPNVIPGVGPRRTCVMPQFIEVGRGLPHNAKTRVVYGMPPCAYP